ncbi:MAG: ABC transporter ATP-binding protein/permease [Lachnospiraceae bacterium]|nr:ABC transporter ATP-binding protein/permease [Lachnospiraceae bacterium]
MWKLLRYLKNYKKESIIGPLFKLTEAIFELIVPLVMSDIIDVGIANGDKTYILGKGALLLLFGLVGLGCSLTAQFFAAKAAMGFGAELRHDMFDYYMGMTYSEHDSIGAATLINRLNVDVNQVQSGVNLALRLFLRSPFIVVGAVIMSFTIDVRLALITLVATPVIAVVVYIIMMKTIPRFKQIQAKLDDILAASRGNLAGVRVVRAFARQEKEKESFNRTTDELYDISIHTGHVSALLNPISYVLLNIAVILVLWYGAKGVDTGRLTQGEVIALVNYLSQILLALIAMVNLINSFTKAIASAGRITEIFDPGEFEKKKALAGAEKLTALPEAGGRPHIRFDNVSFTYPGAEAPSVSNIDFAVEKGKVLGIIGGTGAGKTTLINLLTGFYEATEGHIYIDGTDINDIDDSEKRRRFSYTPQKKNLFKGTIRENLLFGREATDDELQRALEISQAAEFVNKPGVGLDYAVEKGGTNLSGGQQQRLTIARALVGCSDVLILDDSASALDFATDAALRKAIATQTAGITLIIVSQRVGSLMNADSILVLDDSRQVGLGKHDELLGSCEIYKEIYESQTK